MQCNAKTRYVQLEHPCPGIPEPNGVVPRAMCTRWCCPRQSPASPTSRPHSHGPHATPCAFVHSCASALVPLRHWASALVAGASLGQSCCTILPMNTGCWAIVPLRTGSHTTAHLRVQYDLIWYTRTTRTASGGPLSPGAPWCVGHRASMPLSAGRCGTGHRCAGCCATALCAGCRATAPQYASHRATDPQCSPIWSTQAT